jgi:hypothetical protein
MASPANWSIKFHHADPREHRAVERQCSTDGAGFQFVARVLRLAQMSITPPSHPVAIFLSPFVAFPATAISVAASGVDASNTGSTRLLQIRSKWTFCTRGFTRRSPKRS